MAKARAIEGLNPDATVRANARPALAIRLDEALSLGARCTGPDESQALHDLRIAVKRLRYTLEIFAPTVEGADAFLSTLKRLQDALGELHDADVLLPLLAADASAPGVHALLRRTMEDRAAAYAEFEGIWRAELGDGFAGSLLGAKSEEAA